MAANQSRCPSAKGLWKYLGFPAGENPASDPPLNIGCGSVGETLPTRQRAEKKGATMALTHSQQQFILDALAKVISRRYTDCEIKFSLVPDKENERTA